MTPTEILNDPSASGWLKVALETAMNRDPVDAANDADLLAKVLSDYAAYVLRYARIAERSGR